MGITEMSDGTPPEIPQILDITIYAIKRRQKKHWDIN